MSDTDKAVLNRRAMLAGLGAGAGALSFISASEAQTSSLPQPEASTEYDVVVIGSGMAGCAAAANGIEPCGTRSTMPHYMATGQPSQCEGLTP